MNRQIAISWTDLTFEVRSVLTRHKTTILSAVNGLAEFGTLNAVMGPSGAGLTSLMMCLNGMNNRCLTKNTKILLNKNQKIRSTYVTNNEKDFMIMGLTAKQNLIYASKLKNSGQQELNHEFNVSQIMSDLLISDIKDQKVEDCSGGQMKRLAIGLELTALHKPNLIFFDEPTTGLDSNVAEVLIKCLKQLCSQQDICLIMTIHQPNSDLLEMFDNLYVLAKGGHCVYSGPTNRLTQHLNDSNVFCNENQVPIETLITMCAKGTEDQRIVRLRDKTSRHLSYLIKSRDREMTSKMITHKTKRFSFKDVHLLMERSVIELISYKYKLAALRYLMTIILVTMLCLTFDSDIGEYDDCFDLRANHTMDSCVQMISKEKKSLSNLFCLSIFIWLIVLIQGLLTIIDKTTRLKKFRNEHRNKWYSSGVYYLTESIFDFFAVTFTTAICVVIIFYITNQTNEAKRFWGFMSSIQLMMHVADAQAHLIAILFQNQPNVGYVLGVIYPQSLGLTSSIFVVTDDMHKFFEYISRLSFARWGVNAAFISIFGLDKCGEGTISEIMFRLHLLDDDKLAEHSIYCFTIYIVSKVLTFMLLLVTQNPSAFHTLIDRFRRMCHKSDGNLELWTISSSISDLSEETIECSFMGHRNKDSGIEFDITEESGRNRNLSLVWIDMTLKFKKIFCSSDILILRGVKGFVRFGTLTALMGPSGAGKTSLLRCLNGMYRNLISKESKIYLSRTDRIRTCFIAQDQREHLVVGLTVRQSLLYASRLKNTGKSVDHLRIIEELMQELTLKDIEDINVQNCSSGQQKRIVMAMELTSKVKPNLICVDEPTSGVDSHSALLMIRCFRSMAEKHNLSIIVAIHQPTLEILMNFHSLYVLAKGGVCVYSGRPQDLRTHMNDCHIVIRHNQIPIEVLLKVCSNDYIDESVVELSEKTSQKMRVYEQRMANEVKLFANGIPIRTKKVSIEEIWHLLMRTMLFTIRHNWIPLVIQSALYLLIAFYMNLEFDFELTKHFGCLPLKTKTCPKTPQLIEAFKLVSYNIKYIFYILLITQSLTLCITSLTFATEFRVFMKQYKNAWYSCESYFLVKTTIDLIPNLIIIALVAVITDLAYEDMDQTFPALLLVMSLSSLVCQSLGHIFGILFGDLSILPSILFICFMTIFSGLFVIDTDLSPVPQHLVSINPMLQSMKHMLVFFYGLGRCPRDCLSVIMYKYGLDDDTFDSTTLILVYEVIAFRLLSYICLKFKANWDSFEMLISKCKNKLTHTYT